MTLLIALVFASIGIIVLAGLGLYEVTRSIMAYREATAAPATAGPRITAATREERRKNQLHLADGVSRYQG